jgi:hypothetical protein
MRRAGALVAIVLPLSWKAAPAALPTPEPHLPPASSPGMTGGGSVIGPDGQRVTHAFDLHCDVGTTPNVECFDDPAIDPIPPKAPFETLHGVGTGDFNGENGAVAEWTFTDAGDPGLRDRATITMLAYGNHEAHP